ncbi:hypothetical protein V6N13_046747 [Hibiscus sabdariffa]
MPNTITGFGTTSGLASRFISKTMISALRWPVEQDPHLRGRARCWLNKRARLSSEILEAACFDKRIDDDPSAETDIVDQQNSCIPGLCHCLASKIVNSTRAFWNEKTLKLEGRTRRF